MQILAFISCSSAEYFASGRNDYGQLGLGLDATQQAEFKPANKSAFEEEFVEIRAGSKTAYAVDEHGTGFGWGDNSYSQISADETVVMSKSPIVLQFFRDNKIKLLHVDGGESHSVALDQDGNVWTWGSNIFKQLARVTTDKLDRTPAKVDPIMYGGDIAVEIQAQNRNTYIRTNTGNVYAYGRCDQGQCPNVENNKIKVDFRVGRFFVGQSTVFIEAENGEMWGSGANVNSQLCYDKNLNDNKTYQSKLVKLSISGVDHVAQGRFHTLFMKDDVVYGCGNNLNYQMGPVPGEYAAPVFLFEDDDLESIAACEDSSIFVRANRIYVIGIQLYGELGSQVSAYAERTEILIPGAKKLNRALCRQEFSMLYHVTDSDPTKHLSTGMIVAIIAGCVVGLAVLVVVAWVIYRLVKDKHKYKKFVSGGVAQVSEEM